MARLQERLQSRNPRLAAVALACLCGLLAAGCNRSASADDPDAPARLLLHLRDLRQQHGYKDMESLVDPARVGVMVDGLMAVDRLLQEGDLLRRTAEEKVGPTAAVVCDVSGLAAYLGPFSRDVQVVSTRIDGDTAIVAYQVGQRVPVERAEFRRDGGAWRYMPDEPDEALPRLLARLADRVAVLRRQAEDGVNSEQAFIDEFVAQVVSPLRDHLEEAARQREEKAKAAPAPRP